MEFSIGEMGTGHVETQINSSRRVAGDFRCLRKGCLGSRNSRQVAQLRTLCHNLILNPLTALGLLRKRAERFGLTDVSARYLKHGSPFWRDQALDGTGQLTVCAPRSLFLRRSPLRLSLPPILSFARNRATLSIITKQRK
jgi:hypothetical protein